MSRELHLRILTPDRSFFDEVAQALVFDTGEGQLEILPGHMPMAAALSIGEMRIKKDDAWVSAFVSEGFVTVKNNEVTVFAQASEWPEEIDETRALNAKERATRQLLHKQSIYEHQHSVISLTRAMERLRVKHRKQ